MGPRRKRQRLSVDGSEAVTAIGEPEQPSDVVEPTPEGPPAPKQDLQHRRSLFVRSLAATVTTEDLTEHFSESYPIKHALAVLDPATKQCKGYGFVTFADAEDAQRAKEELDGSQLKGRKIRIEIAEPRNRDVDSEVPGHKKSIPSAASIEAKAARVKERKEQQNHPPKLIVRNLPWSIRTPDQLAVLFRSYGKIKQAILPKKPDGLLHGFGIVLLRGRQNAEKAITGVNGKEVDGRTLAVDWAVEREAWQNLQSTAQEENATDQAGGPATPEKDFIMESDAEDGDGEADEESDLGDSNADYEDISDSEDGGVEIEPETTKPKSDSNNTLFIRNLPFSADDEGLKEHFEQFGRIRYARVVLDHETERPRGTGFVCFAQEEDATSCLRGIPRTKLQKTTAEKDGSTFTVTRSILENEDADPTGKYTMDGRILHISRAVDKSEAARLTAEGAASRFTRDKDKRRLYLLSEGTISTDSPLYQKLSPSEITLRESSAKQRKQLIQSNPSLHLSLTRLSIRNIPRSITSKDLKALARRAVVGFAEDVKADKRQKLSKEERLRGGEAMLVAEKMRKKRGKGIVKQAKIVFETPEGSKVAEGTGAGRSRGYGFIEYYTHRSALMGLRWLNGHAVDYRVKGELPKAKKAAKEAMEDRKKRLIVEFAIENANVVHRRSDQEAKAREHPREKTKGNVDGVNGGTGTTSGSKRKRDSSAAASAVSRKGTKARGTGAAAGKEANASMPTRDGKIAQRSNIIRKKRMVRRAKKAGKAV
ncbi:RNA-binding domain-containing protein [Lindgomyces ingoldianus]|uniref:RNA-binding domain-containing protein n=1 Tax=Lindgomyces ingoldianus TaxID=673940 RepID=A0ACB6R546_9PLEO|nr:RNA-binding domain-containing protein [Lindgomyces ingoldianus]KAF2473571.1 RNA-binding domain-containing protein [Lindgomyces ingoldianus]